MFGSLSNAAEKFRKECNMPTHKSAREILERLFFSQNYYNSEHAILANKDKEVDTTLSQLAELVRSDRKETPITDVAGVTIDSEQYLYGYNSALEHIAQKLEGKG